MEDFKKYWGIIAMVIGGAVGVFGWVYNQGAGSKSLEGRTFATPEEKVSVIEHVLKSPTPDKIWKKYYKDSIKEAQDSIDRVQIIKSRAKRDSLMVEEFKQRKYADSINLLNADQLYQIKEELKAIKEHR